VTEQVHPSTADWISAEEVSTELGVKNVYQITALTKKRCDGTHYRFEAQSVARYKVLLEKKRTARTNGKAPVTPSAIFSDIKRNTIEMATPIISTPVSPFASVQTLEQFLTRKFPPKEELIEQLLYKRDQIAFVGRRRHGKTTLCANVALSLALGLPSFHAYKINAPRRVLAFFMEDDATELQTKLDKMAMGRTTEGRMCIYSRDDFFSRQIPISVKEKKFRDFVKDEARQAKPELIVMDNLGLMITADYNNAKLIHDLMELLYELKKQTDAAILIAAHPRKRTGEQKDLVRLADNPEAFFEECMGSSHFINTCGSLWGIERDPKTGNSLFLGGSQRVSGEQASSILEKNDNDWFELINDAKLNYPLCMNTLKREQAWNLLPSTPFTYLEAESRVALGNQKCMGKSTFYAWWVELVRVGLVVPAQGGYQKAL
jgi:hypothetical protein